MGVRWPQSERVKQPSVRCLWAKGRHNRLFEPLRIRALQEGRDAPGAASCKVREGKGGHPRGPRALQCGEGRGGHPLGPELHGAGRGGEDAPGAPSHMVVWGGEGRAPRGPEPPAAAS